MRSLSAQGICQVWELGQGKHPVYRALTVLAVACPEMTQDELAELSVGQRDARLLTFQERTFGPTLTGSAECPRCTQALEFTIAVADIRVADTEEPATREHELLEGGFEVHFRLPNSRDIAAVAVCGDAKAARDLLVRRCVLGAGHDGTSIAAHELPPEITTRLAARMAECDPQAEVFLKLHCPECGHHWQAQFDVGAYLWSELAARARRLLQEVHTLALAYGWSESDILGMSAARRRFYLEMVS